MSIFSWLYEDDDWLKSLAKSLKMIPTDQCAFTGIYKYSETEIV